ncbi:hypothetical protein G6L28_14190 [Agrobacterium larrymoorei]|uniref:hypothetical protein n=1 Tax=Agrobacterium larrymoorei TaxID=160699 RepID=UPI0015724C65|nr:hypothetical protein [Agrobacterium larrymoorei]NTJ43750.1 hypothetical protein [Agrobacterium larrymoorei]
MVNRLPRRFHFAHLYTSAARPTVPSFFEDQHIDSTTDMIAVTAAVVIWELILVSWCLSRASKFWAGSEATHQASCDRIWQEFDKNGLK